MELYTLETERLFFEFSGNFATNTDATPAIIETPVRL